MKFEKLYMFNPFAIQNADSKEIADTYSNLQNELVENADTGFLISKNIEIYANMNYLIGEMVARIQQEYDTLKTEISIDEPINTDSEGNDLSLGDILGTDNDSIFKSIEENDNKKVLMQAIQKLNKREKTIMQLRYGFDGYEELTQKEVADKLGISQSYISRIEKKVINNLKEDFTA